MSHRSRAARRFARTAVATLVAGASVLAGTAIGSAGPALPSLGSLNAADLGSLGAGSLAPPAADAPRLASIDNFRDVAGTGEGYVGLRGQHVRKGQFYRANAMTPNPQDLATLTALGLTAVYDLRTPAEIAAKPNTLPAGVRHTKIQVLAADPSADISGVTTVPQALEYVQAGYRSTASDPVSRAGYGQLLTELANTPGAQVFHCTAGKDRTGWGSALLLSIAGVSRETIIEDYLLSNEYSGAAIAAKLDAIEKAKGPEAAAVYRKLLEVDASYLQAAFDEMEKEYGSFETYLTEGLRLAPDTIVTLREKLLR